MCYIQSYIFPFGRKVEFFMKDNTVAAPERVIAAVLFLLVGIGLLVMGLSNSFSFWSVLQMLAFLAAALAVAALIAIPLTVGLGVLIEFMIDRTRISHYLLYLAFLLVVAVPVVLGIRLRKEA